MTGSPDRRRYTQAERARIAAIEAKQAEYRRLADEATNEADRRHYSQLVEATERQLQMFSNHNFTIWLGGMAVSMALLPWALLTRAGYPTLGLAASAVVVGTEAAFIILRRRRRRLRADNEKT